MKNLARMLNRKDVQKDFQVAFLALFFVLMIAPFAHAIVAPAAGSFAYDVYDIGVNQILRGPIGFVGGVVAIVIGAVFAIQGEVMYSVPAILGGAVMLRADTVVTSLGAII